MSAVSIGPSHSVGSGVATPGATRLTIALSTFSASPTQRCLLPSKGTTSACGIALKRSSASGGWR